MPRGKKIADMKPGEKYWLDGEIYEVLNAKPGHPSAIRLDSFNRVWPERGEHCDRMVAPGEELFPEA